MRAYTLDIREITQDNVDYTVQGFWECACDQHFIHRTNAEPTCPICGSSNEDCPDARLEDIVSMAWVTKEEIHDLVWSVPDLLFTNKICSDGVVKLLDRYVGMTSPNLDGRD